jgi:hypothetical protein
MEILHVLMGCVDAHRRLSSHATNGGALYGNVRFGVVGYVRLTPIKVVIILKFDYKPSTCDNHQ